MSVERIAAESSVYDTKTGEGDPEVLLSLKESAFEKAMIVLEVDPSNEQARRLARWANSRGLKEPNFDDVTAVFNQAGFESYHLIFNPQDPV